MIRIIRRNLEPGDGKKLVSSVPTPAEPTVNDPYDWPNSFDAVRTLLNMLDDAVHPFAKDVDASLGVSEQVELRLDGGALPREFILALIQVSLLEDSDFDFEEDFAGLRELYAKEKVVRLVPGDSGYGWEQVAVFAGKTEVGAVPRGGFFDRWDAQARCWVIWMLGTDPQRLGELLECAILES